MENLFRQRSFETFDGTNCLKGVENDEPSLIFSEQEMLIMTTTKPDKPPALNSDDSSSAGSMDTTAQLISDYVWEVVQYDSLPHWLKDNRYLTHGHRPPMPSFRKCFDSIFRLHTETFNIWSHLLGTVVFLAMATYLYSTTPVIYGLPWQDQIAVGTFFLSAVVCLFCSFLFHTFCNHSEDVSHWFSLLDYIGIAVLITGSYIPCFYYSFYCEHFYKYFHIIIVIFLGGLCTICSLWKRFSSLEFRPIRILVFISFSFYSLIPSFQVVFAHGYAHADSAYALGDMIMTAIAYAVGAILYATRIPERFFPGRFNIWASSHQLFHLCVLTGAYLQSIAVLHMVKYRLLVGLSDCTAAQHE